MIIFNKVFFLSFRVKKDISLWRFSICVSSFSPVLHLFYSLDSSGKTVVLPHLIFFVSNTLWLLGHTSHRYRFLVLYGKFRLIQAVYFPCFLMYLQCFLMVSKCFQFQKRGFVYIFYSTNRDFLIIIHCAF